MTAPHRGPTLCETCRARGERTIVPSGQRLCDACVRACGLPSVGPRDERIAWLEHEVANWQQGNIITARLARRILALYEPDAHGSVRHHVRDHDDWPEVSIPMTPGMVLLYLGGILILTAVIMVASDLWDEMGKEGRFALTFVPVAGLYAAGAYLLARDPAHRVTGTVLLLFACIAVPAPLFLAKEAWFSEVSWSRATVAVAALCLAIHVLTLFRFRSPVLTIPYPFTAIWLAGAASDALSSGPDSGDGVLIALLFAGLALMAVAIYTRLRGRPTYAAVPDVVGTCTALASLAILGRAGDHAGWETIAIIACVAAIGASVYRKNQIYLVAGSVLLMVNILAVGFELFANAVGLPIMLLVSGMLIIAAGYAVQRVRHEYILQDM